MSPDFITGALLGVPFGFALAVIVKPLGLLLAAGTDRVSHLFSRRQGSRDW